ncbi:hypothetical protein [Sphingomonas sp.]
MDDALLDLGLLDQGGALGAFDHMNGAAADHGSASSTCRELRQGHSN